MARRLISSGSPLEAKFGYSRAVVSGDFVFVSGTTGYPPGGGDMPADPADQARNIFKTIHKALSETGASLDDTVRAQYFVTDAAYCEPVLAVAGEIFRHAKPAIGIYVVSALLRPEMKVEIEITIHRPR